MYFGNKGVQKMMEGSEWSTISIVFERSVWSKLFIFFDRSDWSKCGQITFIKSDLIGQIFLYFSSDLIGQK